ncbi:response regulator receiver modulated diguanylate cyclase [Sulfuricella denitrificans skB26]|uniref:diguanylate cyclase n=1 Tax=Sulfuricella denitrificans (strain DSM 22764 / NBRC 105220 / skB26) TaxID=1163617 RepID=S6B3T2_SULDS|nr:response regulator receiver modulated diguanylate cyclase [Sulfuricella denitrificans skB26]
MQEKMRVLREVYAAQLPEKIRQIEEACSGYQSRLDEETLHALHLMVHSLTGSGATFGFAELSQVARVLEEYLKNIVNQKSSANAENFAEIHQQIVALKQAASSSDSPPYVSPDLMATSSAAVGPANEKLVYLVEDETDQAREIALQLGYFGYEVRVFKRLDDFLQAMKSTRNVLVLMDIAFPEDSMGGVNAMREIQQGRDEPVPVMFISALDDVTARLEAVRTGGLAYFSKPVSIGDLVDKLDELTSPVPPEPFRVLIVDDSTSLANYHSAVLEQAGMDVKVVNNPMEVLGPLREFSPDLILMDIYMPECSGLEIASVIRQLDSFVSIPIVYLSAEKDLDKQLSAMSLGGDDFLTKPIKAEHLVSSVASRIQRSRLLHSFMVRDSLTGLLNHTAIKDQLEREMARAKRLKVPLTYAMIDIDHFKQVNDSYGHPAGDRVIKSLSRLLKQRLRETDVVGRYGGEEFAVIMSETDGPAGIKVMDELRDAFSRLKHLADGKEFSVTFSCGIAEVVHFGDAINLGDSADKALYEAKHAGRNRVVLARG